MIKCEILFNALEGIDIMAKHILSVLVNNQMGVLSRVSGLFSRRGYNIDSLSVGVTEDKKISRMTIVVDCEDGTITQIVNQLDKLEDVIKICEFKDNAVYRELGLIKIDANNVQRKEIIDIANIFRAKVIDIANNALILEVTGNQEKVSALISMLEDYGVKEVIRTGLTAIERGEDSLKNIKCQ